jgi:hypothetical protein
MASKPKSGSKAPTKPQRERFIEQARKSEADESGEAFERAFKTIVPPKNITPSIPEK